MFLDYANVVVVFILTEIKYIQLPADLIPDLHLSSTPLLNLRKLVLSRNAYFLLCGSVTLAQHEVPLASATKGRAVQGLVLSWSSCYFPSLSLRYLSARQEDVSLTWSFEE